MTVYYIREGKLVEAATVRAAREDKRSIFPAPRVSRFEAYQSPVTEQTISSDRMRERDLAAADAYDPRDLPKDHVFTKGRKSDAQRAPEPRQPDLFD